MSDLKTIHFYSHRGGPNPTKVLIFLEELGLPYESDYVDIGEVKKEPYTNVNPNGRLPSIYDPNTGITLWEVCRLSASWTELHDPTDPID